MEQNTPSGSVLSPVLFSFFINGLDNEVECTLSKFADGTKPQGVAGTPEGHAATQRDLSRLERWAGKNLVRLSKVLHLGRNNSRHQYMLEATQLESRSVEMD